MGSRRGVVVRHRALIAVVAALLLALGAGGVVLARHPALQDDPVLPESVVVGDLDLGGLRLSRALERLQSLRSRSAMLEVPEVDLALPVTLTADVDRVASALSSLAVSGSGMLDRLRRWHALRHQGAFPLTYAPAAEDRQAVRDQVEATLPQPTPARFVFHEDRVEIVPDTPGLAVAPGAWDEAWSALAGGAERVRLALVEARAEPTAETLAAMRLERRIVTFETAFNPGETNRAANIALAAGAVDGTLLAPGEVFSFNEVVGPRTFERGYLDAPVIVNGRYVPDVGGGVCQVSSTLHVAFLMSGLERVAARNHSIPISYLPMGWDAAVAGDWLDLRYRNNTGGHVYIRMEIPRPGRLRVSLYGPSGVQARRIETEIVETRGPETRVVTDPSLEEGVTRVLQAGRPTYVVDTYTVDAAGRRHYSHRSTYQGEVRVVAVGAPAGPGSGNP